jgi:selenocysteine lyase/cysteine desulfurase
MFHDEFDLDPALIYLNHAAVSPWPKCTAEAVIRFAQDNARCGSAHYEQWLRTESAVREQCRALINAPSADDIALLKNTSEALSVVAHGLDWRAGDNLILCKQEFPSNRIVWESLTEYGVEVRYVDLDSVDDPEDAMLALIDKRTRLLAVSSVQYARGLRMDLARLGAHCRDRSVLFCVDAIQSLGAIGMDVQAVHADFVMADAHKWLLGPEGVALFYSRPEARERLRLHQYGWHMVEHPGEFDREGWRVAPNARRFECGSPNMLGIHALHASLEMLTRIGIANIERIVINNSSYLINKLKYYTDILTPEQVFRRAGIVTLRPTGCESEALFNHLRKHHVVCALRGGGIRFSAHFHNTPAQLDRAVALCTDFISDRR